MEKGKEDTEIGHEEVNKVPERKLIRKWKTTKNGRQLTEEELAEKYKGYYRVAYINLAGCVDEGEDE